MLAAVQKPCVFVRLQLRFTQLTFELAVLSHLAECIVGAVCNATDSRSRKGTVRNGDRLIGSKILPTTTCLRAEQLSQAPQYCLLLYPPLHQNRHQYPMLRLT